MKKLISVLIIIGAIALTWGVQVLFLSQASKWGMYGSDDWQMVFYYDAHNGSNISTLLTNIHEIGTPYLWTEIYYIGPLKRIVGLNLFAFKNVELLLKAIAALAAGFLVFRLSKDKVFAFLTIFFFIIFPSTAGILSHNVLSGGYLTIAFMCFFTLFYIQSAKQRNKIFLASLFFFLALLACPPRAYLILPVPLIVELIRLKKSFKPFVFIRRLIIFYFSLVFLQSSSGWFIPSAHLSMRIKQIATGNLYTLSLPFQSVSTLFIDQSILKNFLEYFSIPLLNPILGKFVVLNFVLLTISSLIGSFVVGKDKIVSFVSKLIISTLIMEIIIYIFGRLSPSNISTGAILFKDLQGATYWEVPFDPTVFQASLGGYIFILGLLISLEWWKFQRSNKLLMVIVFSWIWFVFSEFLLYMTNSWWNMVTESNDKYILACSLGAVIFAAGIFTLTYKSAVKIKSIGLKGLSFCLIGIILTIIAYQDYKYMNQFFYDFNERQGGSSYWQETMYRRFVEKLGKESLRKPIVLYMNNIKGPMFNYGSFMHTIRYRLFYDENGNIIRNNCKKTVIDDFEELKKNFVIKDGEKGFMYDSDCIDQDSSLIGLKVFYPLSNFYAYKIENKEFVDIKDEIISQLEK